MVTVKNVMVQLKKVQCVTGLVRMVLDIWYVRKRNQRGKEMTEKFDCEHPSFVKKCPICMEQFKQWMLESNVV
jgi:hypothetical protein